MIDVEWYVRPPGARTEPCAGGVVARWDGSRVWIALVREPPHAGLILPKGRVKRGETGEQAARREILEEAGLADLTLLLRLGVRERLDYARTHWKRTQYFFFVTKEQGGAPTDPRRRYERVWAALDALPPLFWPEQDELVRSHSRQIAARIFGQPGTCFPVRSGHEPGTA